MAANLEQHAGDRGDGATGPLFFSGRAWSHAALLGAAWDQGYAAGEGGRRLVNPWREGSAYARVYAQAFGLARVRAVKAALGRGVL